MTKQLETRVPVGTEGIDEDEHDFEDPGAQNLTKWLPYLLKHALWVLLGWALLAIPFFFLVVVGDLKLAEVLKFRVDLADPLSFQAASFLVWVGMMMVVASFVSFVIGVIPRAVLKITELFFSGRTEKVKHYLEFYTALLRTIKAVLIVTLILAFFCAAFPRSSTLNGSPNIPWLGAIFKFLFCLFLIAVILSIEKLSLQVIAVRFHRKAYRHRIEEAEYATQVLDTLNKARKQAKHATIDQPLSPFAEQHEPAEPSQERPAKPQEIYQNINQALFEGRYEDDVDLHSKTEARKLARKIFCALQGRRRHLLIEDFYPIFPTQDAARKAFEFFDRDGNGDISKREMREKIQHVYKERKDITDALRDTSQAVGKLDAILTILFLTVSVFVCSAVLGADLYGALVPFGTFFLGMSPSSSSFVMHPYDAGDRVYIGADNLLVINVGLLGTTFTHINGQVAYIPHTILRQKIIFNIRRSLNQSEQIDFQVDFSTPKEKIVLLKERINKYIEAEESREFHADPLLAITDMVDSNKLNLYFWLEHKGNWQDGGRRWARRTRFMIALREICQELDMRYSLLPLRLEHLNPPPYSMPEREA
ncbi:hypothetical protein L0F63_006914 [Massospora cicadina]|nr:hypothetical protein L0F63_006914 [Massospora cicadina]